MKRFREAAVLRNGEKVSRSKAVTIFDIDNEVKSKFLGVEKTDNDGQTYWVMDNPKAVLTVVYDEWREKNEPLYKISIMRKAKLVSAWEGIHLDEFQKDLSEAAYDYDTISPITEGRKSKEYLYGMSARPDPDDYEDADDHDDAEDKWLQDNWISYFSMSKVPGCTPEMYDAFIDALDIVEEGNWDYRCEYDNIYVPKVKQNDIFYYYCSEDGSEENTKRALLRAFRKTKFIDIAKDNGFTIRVNTGDDETSFRRYTLAKPSKDYQKKSNLKENKKQLKENLESGINLDNLFEVAEVAQNTLPENNLIYKLIDDLFNEFMCDEIVDDCKVARLEKMLRNSDSIEFGDFYNYLYDMLFTEKEFEQF